MIWYGWQIVATRLLIDERSASDLQFPMWIYYAALPAGGALMLVRYVIRLAGLVGDADRSAIAPAARRAAMSCRASIEPPP